MSNPIGLDPNSLIVGISPAPEFGAVQPSRGSRGAAVGATAVIAVGLLLWFHPSASDPLALRLTRIWHTLGSVLLYPPDESKIVILCLLALAAATVIHLSRDGKRLKSEVAALKAIRARTNQAGGRIGSQELADALREQPVDSVLVRAVQAVWQARNLQTPDLEAISASVFVLESRRSQIGRPVANRLLLISLLGTIIGLAGVIGTLQSQIGSARGGDVDALLLNLQGTLTTMGTAFSSTAYGILLSVFIAFRASEINERRSHHVAEVQYFAVCELAPRLLPVSLPQAISEIEALVEQSQAFVAESRQILDETRLRNVTYLQDLDKTTRESARLTANVVAGIEKTIRDAAKEVHDAMADAGRYVVDGAKAQITVAKSLDKLLGQATTSMENTVIDLKTGMQDLSNASNTVQSAYKGLNSVVGDLKTSLDGQSQSIGDAARGRLNEAANQAAAQQQQASQQATAQQAAMKKLSDDVTATLTNMMNQMSEFLRRSEPKLPTEQEWSRLQKTLDRCAEASASFATAVTRLEKDGFTGQGPRAAGPPGVTSAEMQALLTTVTRQVTDSILAAPQPLREDLRTLSQDLRQTIQRMEQLSQQAAQHRIEQPNRVAEQPLYRPSSALPPSRSSEPPAYGNPLGQDDARYRREVQRPSVQPAATVVTPPVQQEERSWWQFWKKG